MKRVLFLLLFGVLSLAPKVMAQGLGNYQNQAISNPVIAFLEPWWEKIRGLLVFGELNKAAYALSLSGQKLDELETQVNQGESGQAVQLAEQTYEEMDKAKAHLNQAEAEGKDVSEIAAKLAANSSRQQAVMTRVLDKVPDQAKEAIQRAMERSRQGLENAQEQQTKGTGEPEVTEGPEPTEAPENDSDNQIKPTPLISPQITREEGREGFGLGTRDIRR